MAAEIVKQAVRFTASASWPFQAAVAASATASSTRAPSTSTFVFVPVVTASVPVATASVPKSKAILLRKSWATRTSEVH